MTEDPRSASVADATRRFITWYGQPSESCPLTLDEHRALLDHYPPRRSNFEARRTLLRGARSLLAAEAVAPADDRVDEYNAWREQIASEYLDDEDLSPAVRSRAALAALFTDVTGADDVERMQTLALAGRAFATRYRADGDVADALAAAMYYTSAWRASSGIGDWTCARRAAELWLQSAASEKRRLRRDMPDELVLKIADRSDEWRRNPSDVFESVLERSRRMLQSLAAASTHVDRANPEQDPWLIMTTDAAAMAQSSLGTPLSPADRAAVRDAWQSALAASYGAFALGQWDEARRWTSGLIEREGTFALASDDPVQIVNPLSDVVADMLRLQALMSETASSPDATQILSRLVEYQLRDRLMTFLTRTKADAARREPRYRASADDELTLMKAALSESRAFQLGDETVLGGLVNRIVEDQRRGRIGLALSGGGFRASFYQLGMLARLADLDLLRSVEVISAVSGGAIVGACYYLKAKALLESRHDSTLRKQDYVDLVASLCDEFLEGVQTNIRSAMFSSATSMLHLWLRPGYTRTRAVADLIERELFARVTSVSADRTATVADLRIVPFGETDFAPERDNWRRASKVPVLVINATTLNTGHNWQFTAWTAGEPAFATHELDPTARLKAFGYRRQAGGDGPREGGSIRFADAVAASACVPGLFPPIEFRNLFSFITVRLVDGGVVDNQGMSALIDRGCDVILVSDGAGQIEFKETPSQFAWSTLGRMNAMLMERVRQLQFSGLAAREGAGSLRASVVTHLTRGLTVDAIDPLGMTGLDDMLRSERRLARKMETLESLAKGELKVRFTDYKIPEDIQWSLSRLRTDLDCFHQLEAYALFVSGYLMAVAAFKRASALRTPVDAGKMHRWRMAAVFGWLDDNGPRYAYASHVLAASRARFFKVARVRQKRALLIGAAAAVAVAAAAWSVRPVVARYMPGSGIVLVAVSVLIGVATADALIRSVTFEERRQGDSPDERRDWTFDWRIASERFVQLLAGCALPLAFVWSRIQLAFVDPRYLKLGAVDTANGRVDRNQHFSSTD